MFPVCARVLNNAEGADPEELDIQFGGNADCVCACFRQFVDTESAFALLVGGRRWCEWALMMLAPAVAEGGISACF